MIIFVIHSSVAFKCRDISKCHHFEPSTPHDYSDCIELHMLFHILNESLDGV